MTSFAIRRPSATDIAIGIGAALALGWWTFTYYWEMPEFQRLMGGMQAVVLTVAIAKTLALVWRRSNPVIAVCAGLVLTLAQFLIIPVSVPTDLVLWILLYSAAAFGPRWLGLVTLAILVGSGIGLELIAGLPAERSSELLLQSLFTTAASVAAWALGNSTRSRLERLAALESQALQLKSDRDQEALLAASNERTRIAREMHDIIAHSLSVIIAQADGGRYAAMADPAAGERALGTISEVGRASLADMRRLLGVLREHSDAETPTSPQPVDADLDELVRGVREAGLRVSLVRMGEARPLPPGAGLTVYRIVQEALTNSMKHAGPNAKVTVLVQWLHSALALEITDDGRGAGAASDGKGQGLVGMRERAAIFGGTVSAGPRPGGGFQVKILIPLPDVRSRSNPLEGSIPAPPAPETSGVLPVIRAELGGVAPRPPANTPENGGTEPDTSTSGLTTSGKEAP
ncbi:MAG: sensor histidine kinase [bacterium]|nr:sensor histidine kinase [bacterium]